MIIAIIFVFGVVLGSFVNALVWRLRKLETSEGKVDKQFSIMHGRSMCVHCRHALAPRDLVPVISWLSLGGKCRYCHKPISRQYPIIELLTGVIFAITYAFWPISLDTTAGVVALALWLVSVVVLVALAVYDVHWYELPDRLVFPLIGIAILFAVACAVVAGDIAVFSGSLFGGAIIFSVFWLLFQLSKGEWIGGGDVKIAFALGTFVGGAMEAFLVIFIASLLGTIVSLPGLLAKGAIKGVKIPFGPYLIAATIVVVLFGSSMIAWYQNLFTIS